MMRSLYWISSAARRKNSLWLCCFVMMVLLLCVVSEKEGKTLSVIGVEAARRRRDPYEEAKQMEDERWGLSGGSAAAALEDERADMFDENDEETFKKIKFDSPFQPKYVKTATEDNLFSLRKKNDVLLLLVIKHYHCKRCAAVHRQFMKSTKEILDLASSASSSSPSALKDQIIGKIGYAIMDADEESEELDYLLSTARGSEEEQEESDGQIATSAAAAGVKEQGFSIPAVLMFKWDDQKYKKLPPVSFLVKKGEMARLDREIKFKTIRMAGDPIRYFDSEEEMKSILSLPANEKLVFVIWDSEFAETETMRRLVEAERQYVQFLMPSKKLRDKLPAERKKAAALAPLEAVLTIKGTDDSDLERHELRRSTFPETSQKTSTTINVANSYPEFKDLHPVVKSFVQEMKRKRPGHEYDDAKQIVSETLKLGTKYINSVEARRTTTCGKDQRVTEKGDYGKFNIRGNLYLTGFNFMKIQNDTIKASGLRGDLPKVISRKYLLGMCPGMKRRVIIPPGPDGYQLGNEPPRVNYGDRLEFVIDMLDFDDEEKDLMAGKIDPKKAGYDEEAEEKKRQQEKKMEEERKMMEEYERVVFERDGGGGGPMDGPGGADMMPPPGVGGGPEPRHGRPPRMPRGGRDEL